MNFLKRRLRKRELSPQHSLIDAIELNALNLQDVAAMRTMVETEGWQMFEHELEKDLKNKGQKLEELSVSPEENKYSLAYYGAVCWLLRRQLAFARGILKKEGPLINERNRLRESVRTNNQ